MSFENFVCWDLEKVRRVMNVEAIQADNHLFLATHHPIAMYLQDLIEAPSRIEYDEEKFLKDFLAENNFAFVPVLGGSGTGKSHLIRWLAAKIQSTSKRKVLLIPKIGTNLKDIIIRILDGMEGQKFDEYRQRIDRTSNSLTEIQIRENLLNQLAIAIGPNGQHDYNNLNDNQQYIVGEDGLETLLYDNFFRRSYWLKDGGIIQQLVAHIFGQSDTVENIEARKEFSVNDLPKNVTNFKQAGSSAQAFYSYLISNDDIQVETVKWLNRHLDNAITRVLDLGREDLQRLMREVRETLAEQEIELVLLIEDFAKLQGIDREVLEAVLARPEQPGKKPLCAIRTALACTTGYFASFVDTIKQRITFSVNLDVGTVNNKSLVTQADIQKFVARYLNAVRLDDQAILDWANNNQEQDYKNEAPVSFCNECKHRQACDAGFGSINEIGLYPFNSEALEQMLGRVNKGTFNPRILIKDVLKYTLDNGLEDIRKGSFPSTSLRAHFGNMRLSAIAQSNIKSKDPQNFERRAVLIDLWTNSQELCNLPIEVHTAFNLPYIQGNINFAETKTELNQVRYTTSQSQPSQVTQTPRAVETQGGRGYKVDSKTSIETTEQSEAEIPEKLQEQIRILDNWNNQGILPQDLAAYLREFIYPAIIARIQWDDELLLGKVFASSTSKYFKQRNIVYYSPRVTRETISGVKLSLPLNPNDSDEFRETAIAFQAILQYKYYKNWKFPDGDYYFRIYSKLLDKWSQYVLNTIRLYDRESGEVWNPVPAAVELLAIAATMAGHATNSLENLINALFLDLDRDDATRSQSWKKLYDSLKKQRDDLLEVVRSRIACTKGSSPQFQIIDVVQIIEPLEKVRKSWKPQCEIPLDFGDKFPEISKARQQVDQLLEQAIQEEYDRQFKSYNLLISDLGEDIKKTEVLDAVKSALEHAQDAAVLRGGKSAEELTKVIDQFRRTAITKYQDVMKRVQTEKEAGNDSGKILQLLSEDFQKVIFDSSQFLRYTNNFLDASILKARESINDLEEFEGGSIESCYQGIKEDLADLQSLINEI
ncbi:hypothetical protein DSM106972_014760 [Dulcicalothrix desertica PCC 7102]|uniref:Uncharacterized protein n=1 Tax=Dulcicalothrix desertica PCC 7102 TaxID=232991 RepID=A0A433VQB9_9CYAN|nr:protein DpdH [Dulcicalothrix desertica]RUT08308.1 hypothetical protein DSM106972_014760 [Dulcicalothrix desertica PCC 7102]TWH40174.1 hypothetical protein CAL7102_09476 [Dulcicalothrix desertica PCC 7102]